MSTTGGSLTVTTAGELEGLGTTLPTEKSMLTTSLVSSCMLRGTAAEEGPVAKIIRVAPVARMGCVGWARGRTTVSTTLDVPWLYPRKVPDANPGDEVCEGVVREVGEVR